MVIHVEWAPHLSYSYHVRASGVVPPNPKNIKPLTNKRLACLPRSATYIRPRLLLRTMTLRSGILKRGGGNSVGQLSVNHWLLIFPFSFNWENLIISCYGCFVISPPRLHFYVAINFFHSFYMCIYSIYKLYV